jgi:hypothetical protein
LTGNRGVLKCFLKSEVRSHDACMTADARPNGHDSIGLRVLQHCCKRGFHLLVPKPSGEETPFRGVCQMDFWSADNLRPQQQLFSKDALNFPTFARVATCCEPGRLALLLQRKIVVGFARGARLS